MSNLKKGDLVMTEHGLAWYENNSLGAGVCVLLSNNRLTRCMEIKKTTKEQVTEYIRGLGWEHSDRSNLEYSNGLYGITVSQRGEYGVINGVLFPRDFPTAPAQLAEAIQVATLLNAVKD